GDHRIQFFVIVQVPMNGLMSPVQSLPQQVVMTSTIMSQQDYCPKCRTTIHAGWKYCAECGCRVSCSYCGTNVAPTTKFCSNCGAALSQNQIVETALTRCNSLLRQLFEWSQMHREGKYSEPLLRARPRNRLK